MGPIEEIAEVVKLFMPPAPTSPEFDRDTDGDLLIDWSPSPGRTITLTLSAPGVLNYAFHWDGDKAHGQAQMPAQAEPEGTMNCIVQGINYARVHGWPAESLRRLERMAEAEAERNKLPAQAPPDDTIPVPRSLVEEIEQHWVLKDIPAAILRMQNRIRRLEESLIEAVSFNEANDLLRKLGLDPDTHRTDGGAINYMKVAAALKHPDEYPTLPAQAAEPVEWQWRRRIVGWHDNDVPQYVWTEWDTQPYVVMAGDDLDNFQTRPLYTHPAPVPLTDERIRSMCKHPWVFETVRHWVRITEAAHGIKGASHG